MGTTDLVRSSRDGDQFHYLWASRRALLLLDPKSNLHTITIEGPSKAELPDGYLEDGEEIIDVGEYYGSNNLEKASSIIYSQLKHSTVHANDPFPPSKLKNTIEGFATRYKALVQQLGKDKVQSKIRFSFVSNRSISEDFSLSIEELKKTGKVTKEINLSKLEEFTGLKDQELIDLFKLIDFKNDEDNYLIQRESLAQETQYYLAGADIQAPIALKELITRKALSENAESPEVTKLDVLRILSTNEEELFPVENLIKKISSPVARVQTTQVIDQILKSKEQTFIIQAEGGVGKSIFATQINAYLPDNSICVVFDCFGNGDYRRSSSARHTHKVGLVQIANELASQGLCHPLIPCFNATSKDYIKAFLYRLKQATEKLSLSNNDDASIFVVIDAADNAQMAAIEFKDGRSFIVDLIKEELPEKVKLIVLCRPYRVHLLEVPYKTNIITLNAFDINETKKHLAKYYSNITEQDATEFHRLTSQNPRVQSLALEKALPLHEMLKLFGNIPKNIEDTIKDLLNDAIARVKEQNHLEVDQIDLLCTSIATLRPLIPTSVLAHLTNISSEQIRSIINDIGGHPIRLNDDYIQFVDEPTETWFRDQYKPQEITVIQGFIEKLKPLANSSSYVASALPQLFLEAELFDELVNLSLNSELLPTNSPLEKRKVELQRLQFAIKAGIKIKKYADVAKLSLKAGGESAAEDRQNQLIQANTDLIATYFDDNQIQELIANRTFKRGSWLGSNYLYEAKLLSYKENLKGEARSKLRIAEEWLSNWFKLPEDERRNEHVEFSDIADLFITHLNVHGVTYAIQWLRKSWKKFVSYHVGEIVAKEFLRHNKLNLLEEIIQKSGNNIFLIIGIVEVSSQYHKDIHSSGIKRTLNLLADIRINLDLNIENNKTTLKPIVNFLTIAFKQGSCSSELAHQILTRYMPKELPYALRDRFGNYDRISYMKAYTLEKAWAGQELNLIDLVPEKLKEEFLKDNEYSSSDEITIIRKNVGALLPWYNLYAKSILGIIDDFSLAQSIQEAKDISSRALGYTYQNHGYHVQNEIACIWIDILFENKQCTNEKIDEIIQHLNDKIYPNTLNHFTYLCALHAPLGLEDLSFNYNQRNFETLSKSDDHAETLIEDYVKIARAIFPLDIRQSHSYLNKAIEISNKIGEENLQRWHALIYYAEKSAEINAERPKLAYQFSRCAELSYKYVHRDKHFPWDATIEALYELDKNSAFAIASRWRDRRFGDDHRVLNGLVGKLLDNNDVSSLVAFSFVAMDADYYVVKNIEAIKSYSLDNQVKNKILSAILKYIFLKNQTNKNKEALIGLYRSFGIQHNEIDNFISSFACVQIEDSENSSPSRSQLERESFDWDVFFNECTEQSNELDTTKAIEKFDGLENKSFFNNEVFYHQLLARLNHSQVDHLIDDWFNDPSNGVYKLANFLKSIPEKFLRRSSVKDQLSENILNFCFRNALEFNINRYYSPLPLALLTSVSNLPEHTYIEKILEGIGESTNFLNSEKLFGISSLLSLAISPEEAADVLNYGLDLLGTDLSDEVADGNWNEALIPPSNLIDSIGGYIWTGLASPYVAIRWQAAHTIKLLCEFKQDEIISVLIQFADNKPYSTFHDQRFEFYNLSSTQWLLIALLRVSIDQSECLLPYISFFEKLTNQNQPHLLIRLFAAKIILNLHHSNVLNLDIAQVLFYESIGKSSFAKVSEKDVDLTAYSNIEKTETESFGIDFGPYWLKPLGSMFGIHQTQIEYEASKILSNELGHKKNKRRNDARHLSKIYEWEQTNHSHGSAPLVEDLDFNLSYHAMMIAADKLLQTKPLVESEYSYQDFEGWLSEFDFSNLENYWLSEFRDPTPCLSSEWSIENQNVNWSYSSSSQDFIDTLNFQEDWLPLWGAWSEVNSKAKSISIRSSLVATHSSSALWRALQSAENSHEYCLPKAGEEGLEINEELFQLKGWINEQEYLDTSVFKYDIWSASLKFYGLRPSSEIISLMNLTTDKLTKNWFNSQDEEVLKLKIWGEFESPNQEYSNGYKFLASKGFVIELLNKINMDMIITVGIGRRHNYGSYEYRNDDKELGYLPNSERIYLLKKNGDIHVY